MRARTVGAAVLGTFVLTTTAASAAGLSPSSASLGAAGAPVPGCTVALDVAKPYEIDPAGVVTHVRVARQAAASACSSGTLLVSLRGATGSAVASGSLPLTSCATDVCAVKLDAGTGLETVKATHVLLAGS